MMEVFLVCLVLLKMTLLYFKFVVRELTSTNIDRMLKIPIKSNVFYVIN
jgi:hypothetical protein